MSKGTKPRVLCVDDERNVLEGLLLHLRRHFEVVTAESGHEGRELVRTVGSFAVAVSDMRMPGMSGVELLASVRELAPSTVRILLTGQADLESAIAAVNDGQVFRFLTKPCPPQRFLDAVWAGVEQHRLVESEKVLLEQTLAGAVRMLTEALSLASPAAFGRAVRLKRYTSEVCDLLGVKDRWHIELAAQLSQLGCIALPPAVTEKLHDGKPLGPAEQAMVDRVPALSDQLLAHIPRLEPVRACITAQARRYDGSDAPATLVRGEDIPLGARILRAVADYEALESAGAPGAEAAGALARRAGHYDPRILEALGRIAGNPVEAAEARELPILGLRPGMVFAEDVRAKTGVLLIARGHTVSHGLLERIRNLAPGTVKEPVRVIASRASVGSAA